MSLDDETLLKEHQLHQDNLLLKRQWRTSIVGFLLGVWSFFGAVMWTEYRELSPHDGGSLIILGLGCSCTVWLVTVYLATWKDV